MYNYTTTHPLNPPPSIGRGIDFRREASPPLNSSLDTPKKVRGKLLIRGAAPLLDFPYIPSSPLEDMYWIYLS